MGVCDSVPVLLAAQLCLAIKGAGFVLWFAFRASRSGDFPSERLSAPRPGSGGLEGHQALPCSDALHHCGIGLPVSNLNL